MNREYKTEEYFIEFSNKFNLNGIQHLLIEAITDYYNSENITKLDDNINQILDWCIKYKVKTLTPRMYLGEKLVDIAPHLKSSFEKFCKHYNLQSFRKKTVKYLLMGDWIKAKEFFNK